MIPACSKKKYRHTKHVKEPKPAKNDSDQSLTPEEPNGRRIGYVRVSDADQSEDLQVDALKDAGCDIIYGDLGVSGSVKDRCSLETLLRELGPGDTLIVWKLDRLSRSMLHLLQLLEDLRENRVDFIAITQGIDTTTAVGRMLYGHLAVFAEFEREQIRERTKAGMMAARARGTHVGRPRTIPEDVVILLRQRLDAGLVSLEEVAEELDVSVSTITRAISRSMEAGFAH